MAKYHSIIFSTLIILTLLFVPLTKFGATKASLAATITVDGTVTDSGAPVNDVKIGIGSPTDWQETLTNSIGYYSITIQTNGELWMHVRPDFSSRLSQINMHRGDATNNITQNFSLEHLVTRRLVGYRRAVQGICQDGQQPPPDIIAKMRYPVIA